MPITRVGSTAGGSSTATDRFTPTLPGGINAGDLILLWAYIGDATLTVSQAPAGYTLHDTTTDGTSSTSTACRTYHRVAGASETTQEMQYSAATGRPAWIVAVFRGVDTNSPFIGFGTLAFPTGDTTSHTGASVTNGVDSDAWAVHAVGSRGYSTAGVTHTPPTGLTERHDTDPGGTSTGRMCVFLGDSNGTLGDTAARQYTVTASQSSANGVSATAILRPAAAAGEVKTTTGQLPVTAGLVGTAVPVKATTGQAPATVGLAGTTVKVAATTGSLPAAAGLAGAAVAVKATTGELRLTGGLVAASTPVHATTGTLPLEAVFFAAATAIRVIVGELPVSVALAGTLTGVAARDITVVAGSPAGHTVVIAAPAVRALTVGTAYSTRPVPTSPAGRDMTTQPPDGRAVTAGQPRS